jgi:FkbM family methyltransferase
MKKYYGQWEQDKWLNENIFKEERNGFFVDCGAHNGIDISNTYFFEKELDWKGICIEPIPDVFEQLLKNRNSICIQGCVYETNGIVIFNEIKGYSEKLSGIAGEYNPKHLERIKKEINKKGGTLNFIKCKSFTLKSIFEKYDIKRVNLLCIDTEGTELNILKGIDFENVFIDVILVENNYKEDGDKIREFLLLNNYEFIQKINGDDVYRKKGF